MPADVGNIRVRVGHVSQLFHALDPSPFRERDLHDEAERFIVSWARDLPPDDALNLEVEVDGEAPAAAVGAVAREAVHTFFRRRATVARRELRALLRRGRRSLVIGLAFLATCVSLANVAANAVGDSSLADVLREGFTVAGWVAMWRPLGSFCTRGGRSSKTGACTSASASWA
jgi:hypothetical protein